MLSESASDGALTFEIGSAFVPEDAVRIHDQIERTAPGTIVEVDLHRVRDCHDVALALLARDILRGRAHVALRGVSQHQLRVLGYFGVHMEQPAAQEV
jgi:hypothetical protein